METSFSQDNLEKYVNLSRFTLQLSGYKDEKEIFKIISDSFDEKSRAFLETRGLKDGEYAMYDLEVTLDSSSVKTLEEEFSEPQKGHETVQIYLKRLKSLLPQFGEDAPSVEEFLIIFEKGLHPNLKESVRTTILEQMKRLPRKKLKETIEQLDCVLKVIADSSKDKILKPRNTCHCCSQKNKAFDLDGLEDACDDLND